MKFFISIILLIISVLSSNCQSTNNNNHLRHASYYMSRMDAEEHCIYPLIKTKKSFIFRTIKRIIVYACKGKLKYYKKKDKAKRECVSKFYDNSYYYCTHELNAFYY
ncbi:uncharacterized protein LOC122499872 [Leptopilina heterotoma]|uniref:uncharacterized protein LOC122499872 n=1 Tax=Leptopilina heterotoma TaxID=63436 RepID=UPI001CA8D7CD|nr:uncharacterized protein LOC122499872 [Leptopilina heterotoma]